MGARSRQISTYVYECTYLNFDLMSTQTRDLHYECASSYRYIGNAVRVVNTTVDCSYYNIIAHLFHIARHVLYANFVRLTALSLYNDYTYIGTARRMAGLVWRNYRAPAMTILAANRSTHSERW